MLRNLFVVLVFLLGVYQALKGPFYLLLLYFWIAYFRPATWIWAPWLEALRPSFWVGLALVCASVPTVLARGLPKRSLLILAMLAQSLISTMASRYSSYAWPYWQEFAVTVAVTMLIPVLVNTRERLRLSLVVIGLSLGAEAAKQGWVGLFLSPGARNTNPHMMLGDENGVAVGMLMLTPVLLALAATSRSQWVALFHRLLAFGVLYRAIVTYSRGGLLAMLALFGHQVFRARRHRLALAATLICAAVVILEVMPSAFWDRMSTINASQEEMDGSARGRLHFWAVARSMAADAPLTGIGHNAFNAAYDDYDRSDGAFGRRRSVHSAWFGILAELGYPGLLLFLWIIGTALATSQRTRGLTRKRPGLEELESYATAFESALITFGVGAAFVPFQYTEILWHLFGFATALRLIVDREIAAVRVDSAPLATGTASRAGSPGGRLFESAPQMFVSPHPK